jgi:glycosyltransferase involved in cell wall biosynthesis
MAMLDRLDLGDVVTVVGERGDVPAVLAGADAAVLSSKNETGPLVVLEYMASSLPFVATDTGEVTRQVRDLDVGFVPAPRDAAEVADALSRLLAMTADERRAMGARGRRVAEERFSQDLVTSEIEAIYREVLGLTPT